MTQEEFNIIHKVFVNLSFCIGYLSKDDNITKEVEKWRIHLDKATETLLKARHKS